MRNKEKLEGYKHYCPLCGKEFWAFADWKYRRRVKGIKNKVYYCSYKCWRKAEEDEVQEEAGRH